MTGFDQLECFISVSHSYAAIATMKDAEIGGGHDIDSRIAQFCQAHRGVKMNSVNFDVIHSIVGSVTRFGDISPLWQNFDGSFSIWQKFGTYFGKSFMLLG